MQSGAVGSWESGLVFGLVLGLVSGTARAMADPAFVYNAMLNFNCQIGASVVFLSPAFYGMK